MEKSVSRRAEPLEPSKEDSSLRAVSSRSGWFERARRWHAKRLGAEDANDRGAVMVEYSVLVGAVALAGSVALVGVGVAIAESFSFIRSMLLCPIP